MKASPGRRRRDHGCQRPRTARPPCARTRGASTRSRPSGKAKASLALDRASHPAHRDAVPARLRRGDGLQRLLGDRAAAGPGQRQLLSDQVRDLRRDRPRRHALCSPATGSRKRRASSRRCWRSRSRSCSPCTSPTSASPSTARGAGSARAAAVPALGAAEARARAVRRDAARAPSPARARPARALPAAARRRRRRVPAGRHRARPRHGDGDRVHDRRAARRRRHPRAQPRDRRRHRARPGRVCTRSRAPTRARA